MASYFDRIGEKAVGLMVKMVQKTTGADGQHKGERNFGWPPDCAGVFYQAKRPAALRLNKEQQSKKKYTDAD